MKKLAWTIPFLVAAACSSEPEASSPTDAGTVVVTGDTGGGGGSGGAGGGNCTAAREQLLQPIDMVSTGAITVLSDTGGVKTLFVDASAGGIPAAGANPRIYLNLETATRVDVTDKTAATSTAWDLAIKRPILFTNSGDGGSGQGGALIVAKDFEAVSSADASAEIFAPERFFEADCTAKVDATGAVRTSFDGWNDYDLATNILTPHAGTWLVKGATGKLFKLQILSYYAAPDGGVGQSGGRYTFKVGAL